MVKQRRFLSIVISQEHEGSVDVLTVPWLVYQKHCEVIGGIEQKIMRNGSTMIKIISGYIKVDGEKMKSFQEAKQCLRGSVLETHIPMEGESPPVQASNDTSPGPSAENTQSTDETALGDEYRGPSLFAVMVRMGKVIARLAWDALRVLPSTARNFIAKVRRISKKILGSLFRKKEEI